MAQRMQNIILILLVLDIVFTAGGLLTSSTGTMACWISIVNGGNIQKCSLFSSGLLVISGFTAGAIVVGLFATGKIEQAISAGLAFGLIGFLIPSIASYYQILNNGLNSIFGSISMYIALILVAPLVVMCFFIIYDWWRSASSQ
jgi:hypothetical protein